MINFPKTYLKKCVASKELQLVWSPKINDYFLGNENKIYQVNEDFKTYVGDCFWLPTYEQLISLVREIPKYKNESDLNLLSKMRICISNACCSSFLKQQSMYDFWIITWHVEKFKHDWYEGANQWK